MSYGGGVRKVGERLVVAEETGTEVGGDAHFGGEEERME